MRKLSPVAGKQHRAVAQLGSALRSGRRGREFKSRQPDHFEKPHLRVRLFAYLPQFAASSGPAGSAPLPSSASRSITPVHNSLHNQPRPRPVPSTASTIRPTTSLISGPTRRPARQLAPKRVIPSAVSTNQPTNGPLSGSTPRPRRQTNPERATPSTVSTIRPTTGLVSGLVRRLPRRTGPQRRRRPTASRRAAPARRRAARPRAFRRDARPCAAARNP